MADNRIVLRRKLNSVVDFVVALIGKVAHVDPSADSGKFTTAAVLVDGWAVDL